MQGIPMNLVVQNGNAIDTNYLFQLSVLVIFMVRFFMGVISSYIMWQCAIVVALYTEDNHKPGSYKRILIPCVTFPIIVCSFTWLTYLIVGNLMIALWMIMIWPLRTYIPMLYRGTFCKQMGITWFDKTENKKKKRKQQGTNQPPLRTVQRKQPQISNIVSKKKQKGRLLKTSLLQRMLHGTRDCNQNFISPMEETWN